MFGAFYFPWSKHKAFYHKREEGAHVGGKIKVWPPCLCSAWMGNILISPFDVFLRALALCPALKHPCSYPPELPLPPAYLFVTGASISRVAKHILHGINTENKVARSFTASFREALVWGNRGDSALLPYLARCFQIGTLRQRNGRCLCCCSWFCEPGDGVRIQMG